ncbi:hypothetical protein GCM10011508_07330 [Flavobacterium lutivivi]|nr:hypothetical protein GCM10011508_07330 [Flavobacterium lutivivi]
MKRALVLFVLLSNLYSFNLLAQEKQKETKATTIIVYGSDECHHCIDTKKYLKDANIEFVFFDIDKNPDALKEMLIKLRNAGISTQNLGIPVIDKYGEIFTNSGNFEEFLKKLK